MKTLHMLCLCGIGDIISHISRFPNLETKYPDHKLKVWLGGFGRSPQFMKEILELESFGSENVEVSMIKNLTFHNQLPKMREFIQRKVESQGEVLLDWCFCEEIFQNKRPAFWNFKMTEEFDFEYRYHSDVYKNSEVLPANMVAVQPLTMAGNAEGFESDVKKGRFWKQEHWQTICDFLAADGFSIALTGYGDEDWGLFEYCKSKNYEVNNFVGRSIADTFEILNQCVGNIACNSWTWTVTSHALIPTVCFFTKNHFFIQNHVPEFSKSFWDKTYVETGNGRAPNDIYSVWKHLYDSVKRPVVDYSVCMITLDDVECIAKAVGTVTRWQTHPEFIVVDGGSNDGTEIYLSDIQADGYLELYENKWNDNFEEQKNFALDQATNEWRVWIDADESYESIFWNQLPWYIWLAEKNGEDCISVPRINTIEGLTQQELAEYAQRNGWQLTGFNWINYPDTQQRIFKSNCRFIGRTHERITGYKKAGLLTGVHCIHPKTKARQERGFERENKQYEIEAEKVYKRVMKNEKIHIDFNLI